MWKLRKKGLGCCENKKPAVYLSKQKPELMKDFKTLQELEEQYILNTNNIQTSADYMGEGWYYYKWTKFRGVMLFPMVCIKDFSYILRFDPVSTKEYKEFQQICLDHDNPDWMVLS